MLVHSRPQSDGGSGLTGPAEIPDPPARPSGLRARARRVRDSIMGTLSALPRVLVHVWRASPPLTVALAAASVVGGLTPAATAYTARLLINAVARAIAVHVGFVPDRISLALPVPGVTIRTPVMTTTTAIVVLAAAQFVVYALSSVAGAVRTTTQQLIQERVAANLQLAIMEHASRLDMAFFEGSASYDLLRQAQRESATRPVAMVSTAFGLVQTAITFAGMVALLIGLSPLLALVALLAPIPAFISDSRFGLRGFLVARMSSPLRRRMDYLTTLVTTDTYAKEVRLLDLGAYFVRRYRLLASLWYERQRRQIVSRSVAGNAWSLVATVAGSLTYLYVALQAAVGRLTLGDLTLYTSAASTIQASVQGLLQGFSSMYEHNLYLGDLYELLATPVGAAPAGPRRDMPRPVRGRVVFEHVSFRYPGARQAALDDVCFEMAPGETIAVVGRNGAGKSTLVKLLCRLYDPTEGRILLDGVDLRDLDPADLRSHIGAMFQDFVTYQATAAENIGLGDLRRLEDREAIEEAAARAGADTLVDRLPGGYDTALGRWFSGGVNLSGGEWQKIALARAFLRDVPLLVLDEPTAALDAQAEHELFGRLRTLAAGRTTLYISHRFSTVRHADRILFLEHGRLVEEGAHECLVHLGGEYARLFAMQAAAYADESR